VANQTGLRLIFHSKATKAAKIRHFEEEEREATEVKG